ncbi:MAG: helix-turn-helix domain-containing protein [Hyphomonas sp.]
MEPTFIFRAPSPPLAGLIRCHQVIRLRFGPDDPVPAKPYWPRPAIALAFYPREPEFVRALGEPVAQKKPRAVLIGQPTLMTCRQGGRDFSVYQIELQPGALHRLTGLSASEITDRYVDAEAVFPLCFRSRADAIEDTEDPETMIALAEAYLFAIANRSGAGASASEWVAASLLADPSASIDRLAARAGLGPRQLRRQFQDQAGISPKLFARIARFDRAVRLGNKQPGEDWLSRAIDAGYYDHQHLARDFREFTGLSPTGFASLEQTSPERVFGRVES